MTSPPNHDSAIVEKHKAERAGMTRKQNEIESESQNDDIEPLDELSTESSGEESTVLRDAKGFETKVDAPMWKQTNKKTPTTYNGASSWQKPPSRMSTGDWLITLVLLMIPILNLALLVKWSFFSDTIPDEKRNYARASVILSAIALALCLLLGVGVKKMISIPFDKNTVTEIQEQMKESVKDELNTGAEEYNGLSDNDFTSD